ncbi:MAG: hypothetical protein V1784_02265 [bacterium]
MISKIGPAILQPLESNVLSNKSNVEVYQASFRPLKYTLSGCNGKTYMKLLVEPKSQKVVGADAPEIIQGIGIAVVARLTKGQSYDTIGMFATAAKEFVTMREKALRGF